LLVTIAIVVASDKAYEKTKNRKLYQVMGPLLAKTAFPKKAAMSHN